MPFAHTSFVRLLGILLFATAVSGRAGSASASGIEAAETMVKKLYLAAEKLYKEHEYGAAANKFAEALKHWPADPSLDPLKVRCLWGLVQATMATPQKCDARRVIHQLDKLNWPNVVELHRKEIDTYRQQLAACDPPQRVREERNLDLQNNNVTGDRSEQASICLPAGARFMSRTKIHRSGSGCGCGERQEGQCHILACTCPPKGLFGAGTAAHYTLVVEYEISNGG